MGRNYCYLQLSEVGLFKERFGLLSGRATVLFSQPKGEEKQFSVLNGSSWCIINGNSEQNQTLQSIFTGSFLREHGTEAGIETAVSEETEMAGQQLCFLAGRRMDRSPPKKWVAENAATARFNCTTAHYMTNYKWRWRPLWHPKSTTS